MTLTIYRPDGSALTGVVPDDTSYRHREVMGDDDLTLKFSLARHVEIPVGSTVEFMGETYTLARPEALTMHHTRDFEYTVTFEGAQWRAGIWKFRDLTDGRLKFSLTAGPAEHLQRLVDNLNARERELDPERCAELDGVWVAGECVEGDEACIGYDHVYCSEALALMAEAFGTEYEWGKEYVSYIDVETGEEKWGWTGRRTVALRKVEYGRDDPLEMSYGKGNGFKPDVGRSNSSDSPPVERLYAQGGSDNIDASKYPQDIHRTVDPDDPDTVKYPGDGTGNSQITHSSELLLPPTRVLGYDGEGFIYDEYDPDVQYLGDPRWYEVDAEGFSIARKRYGGEGDDGDDGDYRMLAEDSLDCSEIYPKRVGTVTEVRTETGKDDDGEETTFYDIVDGTIDDGLNYNDYMIGEGPLTIIFQSGELAGREFDVTYVHEEKDRVPGKRFEIVQQEIDGIIMPGDSFVPKVDDTYAVFGCMLPDEYICDDGKHEGAEWDMLRECVRYMYEHEQENPTITGKMDGIWSKQDWDRIGPKVRPGQYVKFKDGQFEPEGLLIRITGVKDYLNSPQSPELELSNETVSLGLLGRLGWMASDMVRKDDGTASVDRRLGRVRAALEDDIKDIDDAIWGDDGIDGRVGGAEDAIGNLKGDVGNIQEWARITEKAVGEVVDALNGAGGDAGIIKVVDELKDAVNSLNSAMDTVYKEVFSKDYSGGSVGGTVGTVDPYDPGSLI